MKASSRELPAISPLNPHIIYKVWGGEMIKKIKALDLDCLTLTAPVGEAWEVSRLAEGPSLLSDGTPLDQVLTSEALPYLVKFIDTSDNLSVQVHPGDEYARRVELSKGKTECWVVLGATAGSGIYLGLRPGTTKAMLEAAIKANHQVEELLNFYPVERGDFFYVPAGTIHAIGKDVLLCEVQQSSGVTYRIWDWNRRDRQGQLRELHVEKAMDVINFDPEFNCDECFKISHRNFENNKGHHLVEHRDFHVSINAGVNSYNKIGARYSAITSFDESVSLAIEGEHFLLKAFSSVLINTSVFQVDGRCLVVL